MYIYTHYNTNISERGALNDTSEIHRCQMLSVPVRWLSPLCLAAGRLAGRSAAWADSPRTGIATKNRLKKKKKLPWHLEGAGKISFLLEGPVSCHVSGRESIKPLASLEFSLPLERGLDLDLKPWFLQRANGKPPLNPQTTNPNQQQGKADEYPKRVCTKPDTLSLSLSLSHSGFLAAGIPAGRRPDSSPKGSGKSAEGFVMAPPILEGLLLVSLQNQNDFPKKWAGAGG